MRSLLPLVLLATLLTGCPSNVHPVDHSTCPGEALKCTRFTVTFMASFEAHLVHLSCSSATVFVSHSQYNIRLLLCDFLRTVHGAIS